MKSDEDIAIAYQITIRDLEVWNNLSRDYGLVVGQKLFIPSSGTEGYATPTPVGIRVDAEHEYEGVDLHECGLEAYPEFVGSQGSGK